MYPGGVANRESPCLFIPLPNMKTHESSRLVTPDGCDFIYDVQHRFFFVQLVYENMEMGYFHIEDITWYHELVITLACQQIYMEMHFMESYVGIYISMIQFITNGELIPYK